MGSAPFLRKVAFRARRSPPRKSVGLKIIAQISYTYIQTYIYTYNVNYCCGGPTSSNFIAACFQRICATKRIFREWIAQDLAFRGCRCSGARSPRLTSSVGLTREIPIYGILRSDAWQDRALSLSSKEEKCPRKDRVKIKDKRKSLPYKSISFRGRNTEAYSIMVRLLPVMCTYIHILIDWNRLNVDIWHEIADIYIFVIIPSFFPAHDDSASVVCANERLYRSMHPLRRLQRLIFFNASGDISL